MVFFLPGWGPLDFTLPALLRSSLRPRHVSLYFLLLLLPLSG
jgi:hypothetical protein